MKKIMISLLALCLTQFAFTQGIQLHSGVPIYHLSQKIGIGTNNPANTLHLAASSAILRLQDTDHAENENGLVSYLDFRDKNNSEFGWIGYGSAGNQDLSILNKMGPLRFISGGTAERMRLDANGSLGIGTTSPFGNLEVVDSGDSQLQIKSTGNYGNAELSFLNSYDNHGFKQFLWNGGDQLHFNYGAEFNGGVTGATNIMTLHGNGNIGIGTGSNAPSAKLELYSSAPHALRLSTNAHANDQKIEFHAVSGTYHSIVSNTNSGNLQIRAGDGGSGHEVLFFTDGVGRAGVTSLGGLAVGGTYYNQNIASNSLAVEGNVGIGTTSPNAKLDVRDGHLYVGDENFSNPGSWGQTINIEDNVHSRILIEERATGVKTSLWAHTGGNAKVGTISNHNFSIIANGNEKLTVGTNGNVGIGTTNPVNAKLELIQTAASEGLRVDGASGGFALVVQGGTDYSTKMRLASIGSGYGSTTAPADGLLVQGNVGIGTTSPTEKLSVDGTILTKKIRVSTAGTDWPDYVFEESFKLQALSEVEDFVKKNKHLPEVPSTKEVEANGLDLGKMDATLLKKVEELTLYLIEVNKTLKDQGKRIEELEKENKALKSEAGRGK